MQNYCAGFFSSCEAEDAALLTQGKDDNEAGREKDKQETANISDREYMCRFSIGGELCGLGVNAQGHTCY